MSNSQEPQEVRGYGLRASDFNGHVPEDVDQYGRDVDRRIDKSKPADWPQVNVTVEQPVKQSRDRAQYVRQQKGHSLTLHLLLGAFVLWIPAIYYSVSPNHYWHV